MSAAETSASEPQEVHALVPAAFGTPQTVHVQL